MANNLRLDSLLDHHHTGISHEPQATNLLTVVPNFSSPPDNNTSPLYLAPRPAPLLPSSWALPSPDPQYPLPHHHHHHQMAPFKSFSALDPVLQLTDDTRLTNLRTDVDILPEYDPNQHLKHGGSMSTTDFCPNYRAPLVGFLNGDNNTQLSSAGDPLRTGNTHVSVTRTDASGEENPHGSSIIPHFTRPLITTTVSGSQTIPFARKLATRDGQNLGFVSFSGDGGQREADRRGEPVDEVKREVMGECLVKVGEVECNTNAKLCENISLKGEKLAAVTIASLEDGGMGLRLGKRMYYGDGGGPEEGIKRANSSSNGSVKNGSSKSSASHTSSKNPNSSSLTINNGGGGSSNKKHKSSATSHVVPKCQVEGCKADLSGARDYHRRHKVCEWHSKASKAKVNNVEQRFCQQCSRFHVLSEFDEGKRSCRRRLAGHNERRRKPPPEPMPFISPGSFAYLTDSRINGSLLNHPYFLQYGRAAPLPVSMDNALLACQLGLTKFPQHETLGNYHALERHHFLHGLIPPGGGSSSGVLDGGGRALMTGGGHSLTLPASLEPSPSSSSPVGPIPTQMAISGRALSLLSSSLASSENHGTMAPSPRVDQFLPETHVLPSSSHQVLGSSALCFSGTASTLHGLGLNHNNSALHSLTSSSSGCSTDVDQGEPPAMSSFNVHSMFLTNLESGFHNLQDGTSSHQHGRPVLDLMQVASTEPRVDHPQQPEIMYGDYQGLSIFGQASLM